MLGVCVCVPVLCNGCWMAPAVYRAASQAWDSRWCRIWQCTTVAQHRPCYIMHNNTSLENLPKCLVCLIVYFLFPWENGLFLHCNLNHSNAVCSAHLLKQSLTGPEVLSWQSSDYACKCVRTCFSKINVLVKVIILLNLALSTHKRRWLLNGAADTAVQIQIILFLWKKSPVYQREQFRKDLKGVFSLFGVSNKSLITDDMYGGTISQMRKE